MVFLMPIPDYEIKWSKRYEESGVFQADPDRREKFFVTFPFPYMDGPLHVGHAYTVGRLDAMARYKRAKGYNVLFPWAWHWTGQPIAGEAKRISSGDESAIAPLRDVARVPVEEIKKFADPVYLATYFTNAGKQTLKVYGVSIDWRREFFTTSNNPGFSAFVTWQYETLREKGFIEKGTHPVVWCPFDRSPVGDHDRLQGEGVSPEEMTGLKFQVVGGQLDGYYMVAVTFRPETIYGVTNLWVSPNLQYSVVSVGSENWIVGEKAVQKLDDQGFHPVFQRTVSGKDLVGLKVRAPLTGAEVPVLGADFIDPDFGTAVVFSVPAHAPYDYLALRDLGMPLAPIPVISVPGHGDVPAEEVCEKMGLKDQRDPRAENATKELYSLELRKGVMRVGPYSGMSVERARKAISEAMKAQGSAFAFYELPEKVVCRCGTTCDVKILEDQWFLRYSDESLKSLARQAIQKMAFYPPSARQAFLDVLDWVGDKPCARRSGLGTPLPWDKEWLVETLSDSTIYMAYYAISKFVNAGLISPSSMKKAFFDYVLLGKGEAQIVSEETGVSVDLLNRVRAEFEYWYPVDLRASGKDLISNHLIFYVLQHVALFPPDKWPRGIAVNGFVSIEGNKMSKSKGNFVTLRDAVDRRGSDALRLALINSAEGMDDPDFKWSELDSMGDKISQFLQVVSESFSGELGQSDSTDDWLMADFNEVLRDVEASMEQYRTRTALNRAFFEFWIDLKWYTKRRVAKGLQPLSQGSLEVLRRWIRILEPFMPYAAEEAWERAGGSGLLASTKWPEPFTVFDAEYLLAKEEYIGRVLQEAKDVVALWDKRGKRPSALVIHCYDPSLSLVGLKEGKVDLSSVPEEARPLYKRMASLRSSLSDLEKKSFDRLAEEEEDILRDATAFLSRELGIDVVMGPRGKFTVGEKVYWPLPLKPLFEAR